MISPEYEINDRDLRKKKYSLSLLEKNIDNLSISIILRTQFLNAEFCIKYILNEAYASCDEETYISDLDVLYYQPHIKQDDLCNARINLAQNMV